MNTIELSSALIGGLSGAIVGAGATLLGTYINNRFKKYIYCLEKNIELLYRIRDVAIELSKKCFFINTLKNHMKTNDEIIKTIVEQSAYSAELRGLSFAIGDEELIKRVSAIIPNKPNDFLYNEANIRGFFQKIHERISQLIKLEIA